VSIELRCEGCGKLLKAPDSSAGKRKKCPACGHELYVATPGRQIEELPLAPEDAAGLEREEALQAERRRLDHLLAEEDQPPRGSATEGGGSSNRSSPKSGMSAEEMVLRFLAAMRDSDLTRADDLLAELRSRRFEAIEVVDQLGADQIPPARMANVPPAVYQGFLKSLRSRL